MTIDSGTGLVLEGGGMRGVFTCGVLDYLLDHGLRFSYAVGVSAGACNGLSYVSGQRGRAKLSNVELLEQFRFIGLKYIWTQHSLLDQHTLFDTIPNRVLPFDYEACFANPMTFEMVTTNCRTGRACYLSERKDRKRLLSLARASSSLPYLCPIAYVDGEPMLDGGIVDSIPIERAQATGHAFNVVVLTRPRGYRSRERDFKVPPFVYSRFPRLRVVLSHRHACYNRQLEMAERMEDEGRILAIRPRTPVDVDRLECDTGKLNALYEQGYQEAARALG